MRSHSATQKSTILSQLDSGHSVHSIASSTGGGIATISRLHSKEHYNLQKSIGDCPSKLSSTNIHHAQCLITSGKADNAIQVTRALTTIINQPLSANTIHLHLKKAGMKAVVKSKYPFLSAKHHKACSDFTYAHKDWTVDDWKKVIWLDETKINHLG